ncbi:MAG: hypothetical protein AB3N19_15680 [Ruegeria sp.]
MNMQHHYEPVVDRLKTALDGKLFPSEWHQWGSRLLDHLRKPVQVAVLGGPGSGKSTLVNMMLGDQVIPRVSGIPVVEVAYGASKRTMYELADGMSVQRAGLPGDLDVPENAVRARVELPDDLLIRHNLVEVGLSGNPGHQMSMLNWVVQWADIVLWCTDEFDEGEQKLWANVPDEIKDHSFLVLTMADRQMMRGVLQDRIMDLAPIVEEEFLGLYPIATEQAITARRSGTGLNEALWQSSGGKRLMDGVLRQIENGRTADVDQATMLLNRFAPDIEPSPRPAPPRASLQQPGAPMSSAQSPRQSGDQVLKAALAMLQDCANELLNTVASGEDVDTEAVLSRCVHSMNDLAGMLHRADPDDLVLQELQSDAQEGSEMMLLFQLEKDDQAAVDAVTLLLQLKKEIAQARPN